MKREPLLCACRRPMVKGVAAVVCLSPPRSEAAMMEEAERVARSALEDKVVARMAKLETSVEYLTVRARGERCSTRLQKTNLHTMRVVVGRSVSVSSSYRLLKDSKQNQRESCN